MNRLITILLVMLLAMSVRSQQAFSLEQAIAFAQEHATEVKLDKLKIQDADAQIKEYLSIGIPKINGNVSYQYAVEIPTQILPDFISPSVYNVLFDEDLLERRDLNFGGGIPAQFGVPHTLDAGIELQTLILDGSYFVGLRAQKLYKELVRKEHNTVLYNVKSSVTTSYLTVLNLRKNVTLLGDNINNLEKLYNDTKAIYENGFAEKLDVDRLDLSLRNLKTEQDNLNRLAQVSLLALKFNMGYPMDQDIILSENFDQIANEALIQSFNENLDYSSRPEFTSLESAVALQDINVKRLKYAYLPSLTGFANYGQTLQRNDLFDNNDNDWFPRSILGVNLSVPIFDGFDKKAKIERAKISRQNTLIQKTLFEQSVQLEVNSNYINYLNAREKLASTSSNLELAENIYEVTKIKFREGVGSSVEVTQAESEWYRAQTNYTGAQYELIQSVNALKTSLGNL